MSLKITCQKRPERINPRALRRSGQTPATVYGHNGAESEAIVVSKSELIRLLRHANPNNTTIDLMVEGGFQGPAVLREVQNHPFKNEVYHLSFFALGHQKAVRVDIPLKFKGTPVGVKTGGTVEVLKPVLQLISPPDKIPTAIEVDISHLAEGKGIHAGAIPLPEGSVLATDPTPLVVSVKRGRRSSKGG